MRYNDHMRILIDMDGVITDLEARLQEVWDERYPDDPINFLNRKTFYAGADADTTTGERVQKILHEPGFFASLHPIEGALEAMYTMIGDGHDVFIVTSAGISYPSAATEKYLWVEEHLHKSFLAHLIITPSKFTILGDVLIDDRPELYREEEANWEHIIYDASYNQSVKDKRRMTWANWQDVIYDKKAKKDSLNK